jgi:hypothetical protein
LATITLLVLVPPVLGAEDPEAILKEGLKISRDMAEILKGIKDKAGAEAAAPKLKALDERRAALKKAQTVLEKLSPEERRRLLAEYADARAKARKAIEPELERLQRLPEVKALLMKESVLLKGGFEQLALLKDTKTEVAKKVARIQIDVIEQALETHKVNSGAFPKTLKALTAGARPLLEAKALADPWGKQYQYDRAGPKNKGTKPDVWTVAPDKTVIGNWEDPKK